MEVGLTRLDGKGRAVIPKRVREAAGLSADCAILVYGFGGCVLLSKAGPGPGPRDELAQALLSRLGKGAIGKTCAGKGQENPLPMRKGEVVA